MKNILIFISPKKWFDDESSILVKIQIDNSLDLGWKRDDIMLVTNFDYEYNGIKSLIVEDKYFCEYSPISTKLTTLIGLIELDIIKENELYWCHDFDAFQLEQIQESDIELGEADMALCDYGRLDKWAGGSMFFKKSCKDILDKTKEIMDERKAVDENAITHLTRTDENIKKRIKKMNISYNFLVYNLHACYKMAIKPLKVAHFHPFGGMVKMNIQNTLEFYKGNNKINTPLITKRLIKIFNQHGVK